MKRLLLAALLLAATPTMAQTLVSPGAATGTPK